MTLRGVTCRAPCPFNKFCYTINISLLSANLPTEILAIRLPEVLLRCFKGRPTCQLPGAYTGCACTS
jgi:hypothetical protein